MASDGVKGRTGHIAISYKHYILVWGGGISMGASRTGLFPSDKLWCYNSLTERSHERSLREINGYLPEELSGSAAVLINGSIYIYGGYDKILYKLDLRTLSLNQLTPSGVPPPGFFDAVAWMYSNRVYIFGGFGVRPHANVNSSNFEPDITGLHGWSNQLTVYDPSTNNWSIPKTFGQPPCPRCGHAADIVRDKVYIFGGGHSLGLLNDLFILNLGTMTWSNIRITTGNVPSPRAWHSLTFVEEDRAILFGGYHNVHDLSVSPSGIDWFVLEINGDSHTWNLQGTWRGAIYGHKAVLSRATNELMFFGGFDSSSLNESIKVIHFSPPSLFRQCLRVAFKNNLMLNNNLPKRLLDAIYEDSENHPDL